MRLRSTTPPIASPSTLAPPNDLAYLGWAVAGPGALADAAASLEAAGIDVQPATATRRRTRAVDAIAWFTDPFGFRHELSHGQRQRPSRSSRAGRWHRVRHRRRRPGPRRADRARPGRGRALLHRRAWASGCPTPSRTASASASSTATAATTASRSPRCPAWSGCTTSCSRSASLDDVGAASTSSTSASIPLAMTLGRHTNDRMTSFYVRTPSGFEIEYGYGGAGRRLAAVGGRDLRLGQQLGPQAACRAAVPRHHPTGRDERVSRDRHAPPRRAARLRRLAARQGRAAGGLPIPELEPDAALALMDRARRADGRPVGVDAGCPPRRRRRGARHGPRCQRVRRADDPAITPTASASSRRCRSPMSTVRSTSSTYAFDTLGADGVVLLANNRGDVPRRRVVRSALRRAADRRQAVVFVHPSVPPGLDPIDGIPTVHGRLPARHHPRGREPGADRHPRPLSRRHRDPVACRRLRPVRRLPARSRRLRTRRRRRRPRPPRALPLRHRPVGQPHRPAQPVGLRAPRSRPRSGATGPMRPTSPWQGSRPCTRPTSSRTTCAPRSTAARRRPSSLACSAIGARHEARQRQRTGDARPRRRDHRRRRPLRTAASARPRRHLRRLDGLRCLRRHRHRRHRRRSSRPTSAARSLHRGRCSPSA